MPIVSIAGLRKEQVVIALFKNAYEKSAEAKRIKQDILLISPDANQRSGIGRVPSSSEVSDLLLRNRNRIEYLGCVKISMDFSGDTVDTDAYDKLHKTTTWNEVSWAFFVIRELRKSVENKTPDQKLSNIRVATFSSLSSETKNKIDTQALVEKKLTLLLGRECQLLNLCTSYEIIISPQQSYEALQKYAAELIKIGIKVTVIAPSSIRDGLINIPAKLEIRVPIEDILIKLSMIPDSKTQNSL